MRPCIRSLWIRNEQGSRKRRASQLIYQKDFSVWFEIPVQAENKSQGRLVNCKLLELWICGLEHTKFIHLIILLCSGYYANTGDKKPWFLPLRSSYSKGGSRCPRSNGKPRKKRGFQGREGLLIKHSWLNTSIYLPPRSHESEELQKI